MPCHSMGIQGQGIRFPHLILGRTGAGLTGLSPLVAGHPAHGAQGFGRRIMVLAYGTEQLGLYDSVEMCPTSVPYGQTMSLLI